MQILQQVKQIVPQGKLYMKYYLKDLQYRKYEIYQKNILNESQITDLYLMLSQFIHSKLEEVDSLADLKITKLFYEDQYKQELDLRDMFKQCPRCSLIWMKVQGCNGQTFCGNRPSVYDYYKNKQTLNYNFEIIENSIKFTKNQRKQKINEQNQSFHKYKLPTGKGGFGCGYELIWKSLPRIQNIDKILRDMYGVSNYEEIKPEMERLTNAHKNWKKQLDQSLKRTKNTIDKDLGSESKCSIF